MGVVSWHQLNAICPEHASRNRCKLRLGVGAEQLRPIDKVTEINAPKLLIVGAEDRHTTLAESQALFAAAREPKELWAVSGAAHVDLHAAARAEYERRVLQFLAPYLRKNR